ncbi:uncharacterized protein A1O9_02617 [Exophiala aquamarina CBS 119918]|uniref:VOC domain-containing protein n=1 Tax=Exophiala aquamarina CBS 119918 TaxID=1182545 RepID=A0A072PMQ6_9EURO|nr:uncharacterized protein A1O9_02617 [Exophiala aquamarina CBS 119918]KEF61052.1 hypothetical protein A1O9_02617 [Exophiala aquamarina CBS 119918]
MVKYNFDAPGASVLPPMKLAHVVLRTSNFSSMKQFYETFLGAHVAFENELFSFITYDDEHHRIGIINIPGVGAKNPLTAGLEHIAFTYKTLDELAMSYLQRKENGIEPFWTTNHGPTTSVYYKDPDGNILETQVDNFDTNEEVNDFIQSSAYKTNPIGVDFEMGDLMKRLQSGEDHASIKRRTEIGPRSIDTVPV